MADVIKETAQRLASAPKTPPTPLLLGKATIVAVDAPTGTVTAYLSGDTDVPVPGLPVLGPWFPPVGASVSYVSNGSANTILGLGAQGDPNRDVCYAARTATQVSSGTANTFTAVSLTGSPDTYDPSNMHDPAVNASRVTIVHDGIYWVSWGTRWSGAQAGSRDAQVRATGGSGYLNVRSPMAGAADQTNVGGGLFPQYLVAGDYLELWVDSSVVSCDLLNVFFCVMRWPGT